MKHKLFLFLTFFLAHVLQSNPLITVLLMVKNEEHAMRPTLQPFLNSGINSIVVLDTGSTDNTIKETERLFKEHQIEHSYIIEQPFINFEVSRNYLIDQAEQLFPDTQFFVMVDAEWYLENPQGLIQFFEQNYDCPEKAFYIKLKSADQAGKPHGESFYLTRCFRAHCNVRFEQPVHEDIFIYPKKHIPDDVFYIYHPTKNSLDKSHNRCHQDIDILLKEYEKDPDHYRNMFFLGQSYANLHDYETACMFYEKALQAKKGIKNPSLVHYRLGMIYDGTNNWQKALYHYIESYAALPNRAEPFTRIAMHYWRVKKYEMCYFFALQACAIKEPEHIYIEKNLYDFTRYTLLAASAWHMKEYEIGEQATRKALEAKPDAKDMQQNLDMYLNRKNSSS